MSSKKSKLIAKALVFLDYIFLWQFDMYIYIYSHCLNIIILILLLILPPFPLLVSFFFFCSPVSFNLLLLYRIVSFLVHICTWGILFVLSSRIIPGGTQGIK